MQKICPSVIDLEWIV